MHNAFNKVLGEKDNAVIIGTDCPTLDRHYLDRAIASLLHHDAVIGPAEDGGYGLIGLHRSSSKYFENLSWGTEKVCSETCRRFNQADLNWSLMPFIWDVDRPEDLRLLRIHLSLEQRPSSPNPPRTMALLSGEGRDW